MARITNYERELRARLNESSNWPTFSDGAFLERLERIAIKAMSRRTVEGCLAAILIYHQLSEEMLRLLIKDTQFAIQLGVFPSKISFREKPRQMFGQLQQELRDSLDFEGRKSFLRNIDQINSIRIGIVHKLSQRNSLKGLTREALRTERLYSKVFHTFDMAHGSFQFMFKDYKKDVFELF